LQRVIGQHDCREHLFQLGVLDLQLLQALGFIDAQTAILAFPALIGGGADVLPPAEIFDRMAFGQLAIGLVYELDDMCGGWLCHVRIAPYRSGRWTLILLGHNFRGMSQGVVEMPIGAIQQKIDSVLQTGADSPHHPKTQDQNDDPTNESRTPTQDSQLDAGLRISISTTANADTNIATP
jgi:hypothetical protein